jgi:UDP-N-acetylmuramoyl-tripeptide--D-alanyl-D-alanine ligase
VWPVETIIQGVNGTAHRVERTTFSAISTDSRTIAPGEFFIPLKGPRFDGHFFIDAAYGRSGGGSLCDRTRQEVYAVARGTIVLVDDTNEALLDLASYKRGQTRAAFVAITGSNGKTTTKELLVHLVRGVIPVVSNEKNYNNQIGVAKTMLAIEGSPDYCIFELGTNHRGEMHRLTRMVRPHMSLITNVTPSHLAGLADLEGVRKEKLDLFEGTLPGGTIFINADDPSLAPYKRADCTLYTFGMEEKADFMLQVTADIGLEGFEIAFNLRGEKVRARTRLLGRHNLSNVLAAATLAFSMGVKGATLADRLGAFEPYKGRFRPVISGGGYTIIDDTYNANPASMEWAVRTLSSLPCRGKRIAILGDMRELGPRSDEYHRGLGRLIRASNLSLVLAVGEAMKAAAGEAGNGRVHLFDDKKGLVDFVRGKLDRDDIVLVKGSRALGLDEVVEALG